MKITFNDNRIHIVWEDATAEQIILVASILKDEGERQRAIDRGRIIPTVADPTALLAWEKLKNEATAAMGD